MNTRNKLAGITFAVALGFTACGGASEIETQLADQNDDLQAQIEKLEGELADSNSEVTEAEAPAPETTTVAPEPAPPTTEAPTTTTEAPTAAPEPVKTTAAPETADEPDEAPALALGEVFASPAAPSLDSSITPANAEEFFDSFVGPTEDFSGNLARLHAFPNISTLPETQVISVNFVVDDSAANKSVRLGSRFTTTATPADAVLAYQIELAELIGGDVASATQEQDGTVFHVAEVGSFSVVGFESDTGQTFVEVEYFTFVDGHDPLTTSSLTGLTEANIYDADSSLERITISHLFGTLTVGVDRQTEGGTVEALEAAEVAYASDNGWTLSRDLDFSNEYTSDDIPDGTVIASNSIATRIGVEYATSRLDYTWQ